MGFPKDAKRLQGTYTSLQNLVAHALFYLTLKLLISTRVWQLKVFQYKATNYHTRAIITRGLYIFYPIFHCSLYCRAVSVTDNLCTKQGNSSIFGSKIRGL